MNDPLRRAVLFASGITLLTASVLLAPPPRPRPPPPRPPRIEPRREIEMRAFQRRKEMHEEVIRVARTLGTVRDPWAARGHLAGIKRDEQLLPATRQLLEQLEDDLALLHLAQALEQVEALVKEGKWAEAGKRALEAHGRLAAGERKPAGLADGLKALEQISQLGTRWQKADELKALLPLAIDKNADRWWKLEVAESADALRPALKGLIALADLRHLAGHRWADNSFAARILEDLARLRDA